MLLVDDERRGEPDGGVGSLVYQQAMLQAVREHGAGNRLVQFDPDQQTRLPDLLNGAGVGRERRQALTQYRADLAHVARDRSSSMMVRRVATPAAQLTR